MKNNKFFGSFLIAALALSVSLVFSGCTGSGTAAKNESGLTPDAIDYSGEKNAQDNSSETKTVSNTGSANGLEKKNGSADALKELKIIKTANVTIEAGNAFSVFSEISAMAEAQGGFVQDSSIYEENGKLTLRLPTEKADSFLKEIRETYRIKNFSENSKDVSDEYTDNQSRLESARTALKRYQELLSKANTIDEILRVQDRIDDITADIESYEALKASYDSRVAYETIVININNPVVSEDNRWIGLSESLSEGLFEGFAVFLHVLIILLYCLPFIIVLIVIIALVSRHSRKKKKDMPPPPPPVAPYPPIMPYPQMMKQSAPQQSAPQQSAPQNIAPQNLAPQQNAPQDIEKDSVPSNEGAKAEGTGQEADPSSDRK